MKKGLPEGFDQWLRRDKMAWILENYGSDWEEDEWGQVLDSEKDIPEDVREAFNKLRAERIKERKQFIMVD